MTYTIDRERKLVILTGHGVLTDDDVTDCVPRMLADPDVTLSMPSLVDLRDIHHLDITKQGLEAILSVVRADGSPRSTARIAIVTDGPDVYMARLLTALADAEMTARQYRSFENIDDAQAWLLTR